MTYLIQKTHAAGGKAYFSENGKVAPLAWSPPRVAKRFETLQAAFAEMQGLACNSSGLVVVCAATLQAPSAPLSIEDIRRANADAGCFFFERDTLRFFKSKICTDVFQGPGGIFFVTSEKGPHSPRAYTVRIFNPATGAVDSVGGGFQAHTTGARAKLAARLAAKGGG